MTNDCRKGASIDLVSHLSSRRTWNVYNVRRPAGYTWSESVSSSDLTLTIGQPVQENL